MKRIFLIISILFCAHIAVAQSNIVKEIESSGLFGPKVKINQPAKLTELMGSMVTVDGKQPQVEGYRVMVYSGNNSRQARDEALEVLNAVVENDKADEVVKAEALKEIQTIAKEMEQEAILTSERFVERFVKENEDGTISITNCCAVGGLGGKQMRDGSFEYYLSEPVRDNDPKGTGPFIWASMEYDRAMGRVK